MATWRRSTRSAGETIEPNSWSAEEGGPRRPGQADSALSRAEAGPKRRLRPESFADHYSQAPVYISQTETERQHIGDAFVFELSKCGRPAIRARMVAGLRNVPTTSPAMSPMALGLGDLPNRASRARGRSPTGARPALAPRQRPGSLRPEDRRAGHDGATRP